MPLPESWKKIFRIENNDQIHKFAMQIGDFNPLHHNHEAAVDVGLRGPIAPGVMVMGFISATIAERIPRVMVCGLDVRFSKPLYAGSEPSVLCKVLSQSARRAKIEVTVTSGSERVATGSCLLLLPLSAETLMTNPRVLEHHA